MAPILIDHRGLIKIGFISVSTAVLVFVSGFFTGYQRASVIYQPGSEQALLALPDIVAGSAADIEQKKPDLIAAGEDIDVDRPAEKGEEKINTEVINSAPVISKQALNPGSVEKPLVVTSSVTVNKVIETNIYRGSQINGATDEVDIRNSNDHEVSEKKKITAFNGYTHDSSLATKEKSPAQLLAADSAALQKNNYSIQVGTYGRLANAENMVKMLQSKNFEAYVSEYSNKKNIRLYNVRFGYFVDKKTAISALDEYKSSQRGDGYLVKFSVESTATTAEVDAIKQPAIIEQDDNGVSPEPKSAPISSDVPQQKISQLDVSNTPAALTINRADIITN